MYLSNKWVGLNKWARLAEFQGGIYFENTKQEYPFLER